MLRTGTVGKVSRRRLLKAAAAAAAGFETAGIARRQGCLAKPETVRDRAWLFGVPPNVDNPTLGRRSLMTPAEGAFYLGIPNTLMVQVESQYGRFEPPFGQYAIALQPLKRVVWSIVDAGGATSQEFRREISNLARCTPNAVGLCMDDFFFANAEAKQTGKRAAGNIELRCERTARWGDPLRKDL